MECLISLLVEGSIGLLVALREKLMESAGATQQRQPNLVEWWRRQCLIGMGSWWGSYLTASSTFYQAGTPNTAQYGIFISNAKGPGSVTNSYASNMGDSGFYIGACADCNATLRNVHAQNNPQGFSGSNSGGHLVLEDSEWDHNQSVIVPSSLAVYDPPSPQNGACPDNPAASCTLIQRNYIHDNNNPNTPGSGIALTVPVGTGVILSGSQNDAVQFNYIANNGSWGVVVSGYADYTPGPLPTTYCEGRILGYNPPGKYYLLYYPQVPTQGSVWYLVEHSLDGDTLREDPGRDPIR